MEKNETQPGKRLLSLHFQNTTQRLKHFPTGTREDLLSGIREVLGLPEGTPLRFRDEDLVIITPDMPDNTVLHVEVQTGLNTAMTPVTPSKYVTTEPLMWDVFTGPKGTKVTSSSNNKATFTVPGESFESWSVFSTAGQHYFALNFGDNGERSRPCCSSIGVIPISVSGVPGKHLIEKSIQSSPPFLAISGLCRGRSFAFVSSTAGAGQADVGVFWDADKCTIVYLSNEDPSDEAQALRVESIPVPGKLVLCSPKHGISVTLHHPPMPKAIARGTKLLQDT